MAKRQPQPANPQVPGETPLPATQTTKAGVASPIPPTSAQTPATPAPVVQVPKKKHGCLGCCLVLLVIFVLTCLAAVGVFFAYRGGYINTFQIKNSLGIGYGEMSVMNLRDDSLTAQITPLDTDPADVLTSYALIYTDEISSFRALEPGRYTIDFSDGSGFSLGSCTVSVVSGDVYQFFSAPSGVAILREGSDPTTVQELNILTSSLCQL